MSIEIRARSTARTPISKISPYVFGAIRRFEKHPKGIKTKTEARYDFKDEKNPNAKVADKNVSYKYDLSGSVIEEIAYNTMGEKLTSYLIFSSILPVSSYSYVFLPSNFPSDL